MLMLTLTLGGSNPLLKPFCFNPIDPFQRWIYRMDLLLFSGLLIFTGQSVLLLARRNYLYPRLRPPVPSNTEVTGLDHRRAYSGRHGHRVVASFLRKLMHTWGSFDTFLSKLGHGRARPSSGLLPVY